MSKIVRTPTRAEGGLTPEEEIKMKAHAELWISRAMRTDPIEPDKIVSAIKSLYAVSGLKEPRVVIVPSPRVMAFAGGFASAICWMRKNPGNPFATDAATYAATTFATYAATTFATYAATRDATTAATRDAAVTEAATRAATRAAIAATIATTAATNDATYAATEAATTAATRAATRAATDDATIDATIATTIAATTAATNAATYAATTAATNDATDDATTAATNDATYDATNDATDDATTAATRDATYAATIAATNAAIRVATADAEDATDATTAATYDATTAATRDATTAAIRVATAATRDATYAATIAATNAAIRVATADAEDATDATTAATYDATTAAIRAATYAAIIAATDYAATAATYAATRDATIAATNAATRDATRDATEAATYAATRDAATAATYAATRDAATAATYAAATRDAKLHRTVQFFLGCAARWYGPYQGGNMWAAYDCYLTAGRDVLGLKLPAYEKYQAWEQCAIHGGFRWMHEEFCMVSDFPETLNKDDQNRPHAEGGPSHRWRDGWELYFWHGVKVTRQIIMAPDTLTIDQVRKEENAEVRRVMIERMGWDRFCAMADLKVIHRDTLTAHFPALPVSETVHADMRAVTSYREGTEVAELLESSEFKDFDDRPLKFVRVTDPSTGEKYVLRVWPANRRAYEAVAQTFGMTETEYRESIATHS